MTCKHCCGANYIFDQAEARKDLKRYKKKGAKKSTQILIKAIQNSNKEAKSILDIGGGVGIIPTELNLSKTTMIDASNAYLETSKELFKEKNIKNTNHIFSDFMDVKGEIEQHNVVTLDRVICCYPNSYELIKNSTQKASQLYGLVFPWGGSLGRFGAKIANLILRVFYKTDFQTYIYNPDKVDKTIKEGGFRRVLKKRTFLWNINLYERVI